MIGGTEDVDLLVHNSSQTHALTKEDCRSWYPVADSGPPELRQGRLATRTQPLTARSWSENPARLGAKRGLIACTSASAVRRTAGSIPSQTAGANSPSTPTSRVILNDPASRDRWSQSRHTGDSTRFGRPEPWVMAPWSASPIVRKVSGWCPANMPWSRKSIRWIITPPGINAAAMSSSAASGS